MHQKGYGAHHIPKRNSVSSEALSRREGEWTGLLYQTPVCRTTSWQEYKGYKKILQENVFHGSIVNIHVTLMELSRHVVSLELANRLKELGMKQESLFYWHTWRYRREWFIALPCKRSLMEVWNLKRCWTRLMPLLVVGCMQTGCCWSHCPQPEISAVEWHTGHGGSGE